MIIKKFGDWLNPFAQDEFDKMHNAYVNSLMKEFSDERKEKRRMRRSLWLKHKDVDPYGEENWDT